MRLMTFGWESSEQRAISLHADCEMPVYWITSPSLSGLNLYNRQLMEQYSYNQTDSVVLLDGEFSGLPVPADSFVHSSIGSAADEAYNSVSIQDTDFGLVDA